MARIGIFVCHCGINIASVVDVNEVVETLQCYPGVAYVADYRYMCSEPGQRVIKDAIKENELDRVIVAACSPTLHETTFRRTVVSEGVNPYLCEIANIREHCSWVHRDDKKKATRKAITIIKSMVEKIIQNESLFPIKVPLTKKALVIGGGISGIQASLDIANSGHEVVLVERQPSIGGRMIGLHETYPEFERTRCILVPKMVEVARHPRIKLITCSEVEEVDGYVGNFTATIKRKPRYVNEEKCIGCGVCVQECPVAVPLHCDALGDSRRALYVQHPQSVPNVPIIDRDHCLYFKEGTCKACEKICPFGAIELEQTEAVLEEEIGAIIVATGYGLYARENIGEYGYGKYPDVIDSLQYEKMLSASSGAHGAIKRPSDGKIPEEIVFIQCVGFRNPEQQVPYCSKICCLYTAKHAILYKQNVPHGQAYVFYTDIRAGGKGNEEFIQEGIAENRIIYLRGEVSRVFQDGEKVVVWGEDTLTGRQIEVAADLVVLAPAMIPAEGAQELASRLKIATDINGFLTEAHPKLRPVESLTLGVFLAGCCQAPKDIPESIAQASGAASKVLGLFSGDEISHEPIVVAVESELCRGCGLCVLVCPYDARELDDRRKIAKINEILCQGCGACVVACPNNACQQRNFSVAQILAMADALI